LNRLEQQDSAEHVIHNWDGTIGERDSYGNDPSAGEAEVICRE